MSFQFGPEDAEAQERWKAGMEYGRQTVNAAFESIEPADVPFFLAVATAIALKALYHSEPERQENVPIAEAAMDLGNVVVSTVLGEDKGKVN